MNTKNNQRYQETEHLLKNTMLQLMKDSKIEEITVKEVCQKAGITSESEMLYYFVYFQAGFTLVLKRWVDQGCIEPASDIATILSNCIPYIWKKPPYENS